MSSLESNSKIPELPPEIEYRFILDDMSDISVFAEWMEKEAENLMKDESNAGMSIQASHEIVGQITFRFVAKTGIGDNIYWSVIHFHYTRLSATRFEININWMQWDVDNDRCWGEPVVFYPLMKRIFENYPEAWESCDPTLDVFWPDSGPKRIFKDDISIVRKYAPSRPGDYIKWVTVWKEIKKFRNQGIVEPERLHEKLDLFRRQLKYLGPFFTIETLRKIIKAGEAGELETS